MDDDNRLVEFCAVLYCMNCMEWIDCIVFLYGVQDDGWMVDGG